MSNNPDWLLPLAELEGDLLSLYAGILPPCFEVRNVPIGGGEWLHCLIGGAQHLPPLLMVHGFGGCGLLFVRMFRRLATQYRVVACDLLGTGMSSRTEYRPDCLDSAITYFTDSFERLRVAL
jgi:pimeloyl-ACP methyl ester carboxylesterase